MNLTIIDSGKGSAQDNMSFDTALLENLRHHNQPILHLYEWAGEAMTYGYFIDPFKWLDPEAIERRGLDIARRPTGGGIIFHQTDIAFSILIPASHSSFSFNTLENYAFINHIVENCIHRFLGIGCQTELLDEEKKTGSHACDCFCMANPTQYDIMLEGSKVGGAAQRRTKWGYLHQGSVSLGKPPEECLQDVLREGSNIIEEMKKQTFALLDRRPMPLNDARKIFKDILIQECQNSL